MAEMKPVSTGNASVRINLSHDVTVNGTTYSKGTQEVPTERAEDLMRIDREYSQHLQDRHVKHTHERDMGTMSVGGE
jgi:hypothetical protein